MCLDTLILQVRSRKMNDVHIALAFVIKKSPACCKRAYRGKGMFLQMVWNFTVGAAAVFSAHPKG